MSMPEIPNKNQKDALVDLLESIALEEAALAHLINAEADKIERIIDDSQVTPTEIISFQKEVSKVLKTTIKKEMLLQFKLEEVLEAKGKEVSNDGFDVSNEIDDNSQEEEEKWDSDGYYQGDYYEDDLEE